MAGKSIVPPPRVFIVQSDGTRVEVPAKFGLDADLSRLSIVNQEGQGNHGGAVVDHQP